MELQVALRMKMCGTVDVDVDVHFVQLVEL